MLSPENHDMQFDERVSNGYILQMQKERYAIFKSQDLEKGSFDVTFEVEGKVVHANRYVLTSASEYMKVSLSDRWSKKDEIIKIESYSYDNFYEFLCFIYSGHCKINRNNVFNMVDMSEFYDVAYLQEFCVKFLSNEKYIGVENIEKLAEIALQYSLHELIDSIKEYIVSRQGKAQVYDDNIFLTFKKPFIQFLSTLHRNCDQWFSKSLGLIRSHSLENFKKESEFFEAVYKWAENRVIKQKDVKDNDFNLLESIKAELADILPNIQFAKMSFAFLMDFVLEKGFFLSSTEFKFFFKNYQCWEYSKTDNSVFFRDESEDENLDVNSDDEDFDDKKSDDEYFANEKIFLKTVYELAEKQALKKEEMTPEDQDFNFVESIRSDLIEVIPLVKFHKLDKTFLKVFVVANGILSKEQANHVYDTRVQVKNNGKFIYGSFTDTLGIRDAIKNEQPCKMVRRSTAIIRFLKLKFRVPKGRSTVKKMSGVQWYLCLDKNGILSFRKHTAVKLDDYLLCEMKPKKEFFLTPDEETHIKAYYNNVPDL